MESRQRQERLSDIQAQLQCCLRQDSRTDGNGAKAEGFASAVLQSPACKHVRISYEPVGEVDMKDYLSGWSLTFDVGIDSRDIDYSNSAWLMLDNKTKKRFEGPLKNAAEVATQICIAATGRGGLLSQ